jgi:phospholipase A1/A2
LRCIIATRHVSRGRAMRIRAITSLLLLLVSSLSEAGIVISIANPRVAPGSPVELTMTIANDSPDPMTVDLPSPLHLRFETKSVVTILDFTPSRIGAMTVEPGSFSVINLQGVVPSAAEGFAVVTATGFETNALALNLEAAAPGGAFASSTPSNAPQAERASNEAMLVDKPPPLAVSVYEPVYVIVGGDDGLNAKFQISFRYRLFDGEGALANRLPWIDDLYLAFSQTSLWDLNELSKPFKDSSYRPRLFFSNYDLGRLMDGRLRLGIETGFGHESNGKEGDSSRSFNMFYARPTLTYGDPEGFNVYAAPLIHNYIAADENPDIADYRGYVDWLFGAGSKGGLNFWTVIRKGRRSDFGSTELNLSYPLSKLSGGDLTGWLMLQYFGGHGESLLDYNQKLDSQLRLGIAIAL